MKNKKTNQSAETPPSDKTVRTEEAKRKAERALEGAGRHLKSELDEAYHQGQPTEKSGPVGKQIRTG